MTVRTKLVATLAVCLTAATFAHAQDAAAEKATPDIWAAVRKPTSITLKLKNVMWLDAYKALAKASGDQITVPKEDSNYSLPLSIDMKGVPFLKALDDLQKAAPVYINTSSGKRAFQLSWSSGQRVSDYTAYAGPARLMIESYNIERSARTYFRTGYSSQRPRSTSMFNMRVMVEPRVRVSSIAVEIDEMADDTGKDLLKGTRRGVTFGQARTNVHRQSVANSYLNVSAGIPARNATKIARMKGKLVLSVMPDLPDRRLELAKQNQEIKMPDGVYKLVSTNKDDRGSLVLTLSAPQGYDRNKAYQRFRTTSLIDAKKVSRQHPSTSFRHREDGTVDLELRFSMNQGFEPVALVVPNASEPEAFDYPFAFTHVALPPLESAYFTPKIGDTPAVKPAPAPMPAAPDHLLPIEQLKASSFAIDVAQQPILGVVDRIARETGNTIDMPDYRPTHQGAQEGASPPITLKMEKMAFWPGIDKLCAAAMLQPQFYHRSNEMRLTLRRQHRKAVDGQLSFIDYTGPVRIQIYEASLQARSSITYTSNSAASDSVALYLNGTIWLEPRVQLAQHGASVEVCVGDDGTDMMQSVQRYRHQIHQQLRDPRCRGSVNTSGSHQSSFSLSIPLKDERLPKQIAEMTVYYFAMVSDKEQTLEITEPAKINVYELEEGIKVLWAGVQKHGTQRALRYGIQSESGMAFTNNSAIAQRFEGTDKEGKPIKGYPNTHNPGGNTLVITRQLSGNQEPAKVTLKLPGKMKTYAGLVTFKNIPLPRLPEVDANDEAAEAPPAPVHERAVEVVPVN